MTSNRRFGTLPLLANVSSWALPLLLISGASLGSACGPSTTTTSYEDPYPPPKEPLVTTGELGRYGGRFIVIGNGSPGIFNPLMSNTVPSNELITQLFTRLTRVDGVTQELQPMLATRWEQSADELTWTFHLRSDAKFSDGHPLTADDVAFTLAAAYDPEVASAWRSRLLSKDEPWQVTVRDAETIAFNTAEPVAVLPEVLSTIFILPKHVLEPRWKAGTLSSAYALTTPPDQLVTSGAWRIKAFTAHDRTVLVRNPFWFQVDAAGHRLPYLDELVVVDVPDLNTGQLKFVAGEVDAFPTSPPENYAWYADHERDGHFKLYDLGPYTGITYFWFNLKRKPTASGHGAGEPYTDPVKFTWFNNVTFRRAVSMAVDRDAMIHSVYTGEAVKNWSYATAGDKLWYLDDVPHDDYNPTEARRLLASLGLQDRDGDGVLDDVSGHPIAFTLKTNSNNGARVAMANFVRDDLAKVGIKVTPVPMEFNTIVANNSRDYQYEAMLLGQQPSRLDPSAFQSLRSSDINHSWSNLQPKPETPEEARIDALLDALGATSDRDARLKIWRDIQTMLNQQAWMIWLPVQVLKVAVRDRFGNVRPSVIGLGLQSVAWNSEEIYVRAVR